MKIGDSIKKAWQSIMGGQILLNLGVHRLFPHIIFIFGICMVSLILSFYADRTLEKRERKMKELEEAKIEHSSKYRELVSLYRYTTMEDMLQEQGSDLEPLREPVTKLK